MELAGLEPATSWVRSVSGWDSGERKGTIEPFLASCRGPDSPPLPCSTHHNSPQLLDLLVYAKQSEDGRRL
jgi:hypothetical protein